MIFEVDNKKYEILNASNKDGLSSELWDVEKNKLLIEILRNDSLKRIEFYSAEISLPFEMVEKVLLNFWKASWQRISSILKKNLNIPLSNKSRCRNAAAVF